MKSLRLKTIADMVSPGSSVIDIGTDHAYIPIYLVKSNIVTKVWATDISKNAIESAKANVEQNGLSDKIHLCVADGFVNINEVFDVGILAGMGSLTMMQILQNDNLPKALILQSNNDLGMLRRFMQKLGYTLVLEKIVYEKKKYYSIMQYKIGKEELKEEEILFGKSKNIVYLNYLLDNYKKLYKKSKQDVFLQHAKSLEDFIEKIQAVN